MAVEAIPTHTLPLEHNFEVERNLEGSLARYEAQESFYIQVSGRLDIHKQQNYEREAHPYKIHTFRRPILKPLCRRKKETCTGSNVLRVIAVGNVTRV